MHLHHATNDDHQNHHKLLALSTTTPSKFSTIDCESPEDGLTPTRSVPFEANFENTRIIASLDGLVCVGINNPLSGDEYFDIILWNPLTGEYKTLSQVHSHYECYKADNTFGLYYTSVDDDYKLLCVTQYRNTYIYSLKTESWRKLECPQGIPYSYGETWKSSVFLNEKLYFLKEVRRGRSLFSESYSIVRFDCKTEKWREIGTPFMRNDDDNVSINCLSFMVLRGCIHLCVAYRRESVNGIELWKMERDRDGEWTKVVSYGKTRRLAWFPHPQHLMRKGNWVLDFDSGGFVYKVGLEKHMKDELCWYTVDDMGVLEGGTFIQTFVSLNR